MTTIDWSGIRDRVLRLREAPGALEVFGARRHQWVLDDPLSIAQIGEIEDQIGMTLPADYRGFLLHVGAGGAGPWYGIFSLRETPEGWRWFDDVKMTVDHELLSVPFPNPLHATADSLWKALHDDHPDEHPDRYPDPNSEETRAARRAWVVRERALAQKLKATGVLPLSHQGCGMRDWLVVTGEERGTMWCDPEGDGVHLYAGYLPGDPEFGRITFGQYYLLWLEEATRTASRRTRA
ncbi:SMI1/KNR4 family protein [Streptomyces wedmorensis]